MMPSEATATSQLPAFLADPRGILLRRWKWMAGALAVGALATALTLILVPVTYVASANVLMSKQQIPEQFVAVTAPTDPLDAVDALVGEILARDRLTAVIEKHHLYAKDRKSSTMIELVVRARSSISVTAVDSPFQTRRGPPANLFTISFRDEDPELAANVANELATMFTAAASRMTGQQARLTSGFMRAELERSERELRAQEERVSAFKAQYIGELPSELPANLARLDRLQTQRQTLGNELSRAEARLADLTQLGDLQNPASPYARLSALRASLAAETAVNTDEHPNVIALRRQIEALEKEVSKGDVSSGDPRQGVAVRSAQKEVADLRAQLASTAAESQKLEERVAQTPKREEEFAALTQRESVMRETYLSNLRKLESASLSESVESAQQGARVQVLDRAVPPTAPERTQAAFLFGGVAASLLAAVGVALLLELTDPVVISAHQLDLELDLPVLGSVGRIGA